MVIPCFECGDDVAVDDDAEMEAALCPSCIGSLAYWGSISTYMNEYAEEIADHVSYYEGYQYTEV